VHSLPFGRHSNIFELTHGVTQNRFRAIRRFRARCRDAFKTLHTTSNAVGPTDLHFVCKQALADLGISCDLPDVAEEGECDTFSIFMEKLELLLYVSDSHPNDKETDGDSDLKVINDCDPDELDRMIEALDGMSDEDRFDEFLAIQGTCMDESLDLQNVNDSFNDCHEFASGEMRGLLDSHVQERSGEEVCSAKMVLSNIPLDIPAPISSLFQSLWECPLGLPEDKVMALAGQKAEDHCLGTDVTKEMAITGAVQIWKTSRQVVMQQISSLSSWGAVTDASDVVNSVNSEDVAESKTKWRPD